MRSRLMVLALALSFVGTFASQGEAEQFKDPRYWKDEPLYCNPGDYMVGVGGRVGNWVNNVYPICAHFNPATADFDPSYSGPGWGDNGGAPQEDRCGPRNVVNHVESRQRADFFGDTSSAQINGYARMQYVAFTCQPAMFLFQPDTKNHGISSTVEEVGMLGPEDMPIAKSDCTVGSVAVGLDASRFVQENPLPKGEAYDPYPRWVNLHCSSPPQAETISQLPPGTMKNADLFGSDMPGDAAMTVNDPALCYEKCVATQGCLGWTYVHPGIQGPSAACHLKNPLPKASANNCCISGAIITRQLPAGAATNVKFLRTHP